MPRSSRNSLFAIVVGALLCWTSSASAHDSDAALCQKMSRASFASSDGPAQLTIVSPQEGETLRSRNFELLYTIQGDTATARLDHVHWKLSEFDNNTAPDLSGVVNVASPREGDHTLTVYMATPEHVVITQKYVVNFRVITQGALFLAPSDQSEITSSDLMVNYNTFGIVPADTRIRLTLDDNSGVFDEDGDGEFLFRGLTDGEHTVRVWLVDAADTEFGDGEVRTITVRSTLSPNNASKAYKYFQRAQDKRDAKGRAKELNRLRTLLLSMQSGGNQSPVISALNNENVTRALKYTDKLLKKPKDKTALKKLKALLKDMKS